MNIGLFFAVCIAIAFLVVLGLYIIQIMRFIGNYSDVAFFCCIYLL